MGGQLYEMDKGNFNEDLVVEYYDIQKKEYISSREIIGKKITSDRDIIVYKTCDDVIDGPPVTFESKLEFSENSRLTIVKSGEVFTVLNMIGERTKIKVESGEEGWNGGFHMVWHFLIYMDVFFW